MLKNILAAALAGVTILTVPVCVFAEDTKSEAIVQEAEMEISEIAEETEQPVIFVAAASSGGKWVQESNGRWWYKHSDGSYTKYNWEYINGNWYFFDKNGWMWTDWLQWNGESYYLDPASGKMHTGWSKINGEWYYFKSNGAMNIMPLEQNNRFYTFYTSGSQKGWLRSTILYVDEEKQEMSNWCWAASSAMVGKYNTTSSVNQSYLVYQVKGLVVNLGGSEQDEVKGIYVASKETKNATIVGNANFDFTSIINLIDRNHPLIMNLYWNDKTKHAVVCAGYDRHTGQIYIVNPAESLDPMLYDYKTFMTKVTMGESVGHCVNMVKY